MTEIEVFHSYCADRRRIGIDGFEAHQFDHLMRYTSRNPGVDGLVAYANLRTGFEVAQIQEQIAYFQALRQKVDVETTTSGAIATAGSPAVAATRTPR